MSKISVQLEYEKKAAQLHSLVEDEAKKLQNTIESRDSALLELREIQAEKVRLNKIILDLKKEAEETRDYLLQITEQNENYKKEAKQEFDKEKQKESKNKELLKKITDSVEESNKVALNFGEFIKNESVAREKYLNQKGLLETSEKKYQELESKIKSEREDIEKEKKNLNDTKKYLTELYGKIGSYVDVMKKTAEYVNNYLKENNVPLQFNLPEGEIAKIDINNFQEHL